MARRIQDIESGISFRPELAVLPGRQFERSTTPPKGKISEILTPQTVWTIPTIITSEDARSISEGWADNLPVTADLMLVQNRAVLMRQSAQGRWEFPFSQEVTDLTTLSADIAEQLIGFKITPRRTGLYTAVVHRAEETRLRLVYFVDVLGGDYYGLKERDGLSLIPHNKMENINVDPENLNRVLSEWKKHPYCIA